MQYAGFWSRFFAALVDALILLPFIYVYFWLLLISREIGIIAELASIMFFSGYDVFCHAKWGQTLGKWLVGIKVTKLDGSAIGWREAIMRSSVSMIMRLVTALGKIYGLIHIPDSTFIALQNEGFFSDASYDFLKALSSLDPMPDWYILLEQLWVWSELITMLFNKQKRALHDYMGGTIVIRK